MSQLPVVRVRVGVDGIGVQLLKMFEPGEDLSGLGRVRILAGRRARHPPGGSIAALPNGQPTVASAGKTDILLILNHCSAAGRPKRLLFAHDAIGLGEALNG